MATWVTHMMIADGVLESVSELDRRGFCVGNIAPDCNVENKDWTRFTPSRRITHWMDTERKKASDCKKFYEEYIENRWQDIRSEEEYSFLLGYYSHLMLNSRDLFVMKAGSLMSGDELRNIPYCQKRHPECRKTGIL